MDKRTRVILVELPEHDAAESCVIDKIDLVSQCLFLIVDDNRLAVVKLRRTGFFVAVFDPAVFLGTFAADTAVAEVLCACEVLGLTKRAIR